MPKSDNVPLFHVGKRKGSVGIHFRFAGSLAVVARPPARAIPLLSTRFLPVLEDEIARMNGAKEGETEGPSSTPPHSTTKRGGMLLGALGLELLPRLTRPPQVPLSLSKSQMFVQDRR